MNLRVPHTKLDCDECCTSPCVDCYRRTGETVCVRTCEHAVQHCIDMGDICEHCKEPCWDMDVPCHPRQLEELGMGPVRRIGRTERLQGLADAGVDTWEDYRGEK